MRACCTQIGISCCKGSQKEFLSNISTDLSSFSVSFYLRTVSLIPPSLYIHDAGNGSLLFWGSRKIEPFFRSLFPLRWNPFPEFLSNKMSFPLHCHRSLRCFFFASFTLSALSEAHESHNTTASSAPQCICFYIFNASWLILSLYSPVYISLCLLSLTHLLLSSPFKTHISLSPPFLPSPYTSLIPPCIPPV